eukprot:365170-Chlamydomonas_euryale.AAC.1
MATGRTTRRQRCCATAARLFWRSCGTHARYRMPFCFPGRIKCQALEVLWVHTLRARIANAQHGPPAATGLCS